MGNVLVKTPETLASRERLKEALWRKTGLAFEAEFPFIFTVVNGKGVEHFLHQDVGHSGVYGLPQYAAVVMCADSADDPANGKEGDYSGGKLYLNQHWSDYKDVKGEKTDICILKHPEGKKEVLLRPRILVLCALSYDATR